MPPPKQIEIPKFPGNKRMAVTLSFDDGVVPDVRALEFFNAVGLKATWNLNSGKFGQMHGLGRHAHVKAADVAKIYAGHEVGIHTVTHPWLDRLDASQIATEVLEDRKALEDLVGYPVRGMAYPFGVYDGSVINVLRALGIVYARTCENSNNCFPPTDPLAWRTTGYQFDADLPEKWRQRYGDSGYSGVFSVWGHTYEFPARNDWPAVERIYSPFAGKGDVWYCTNIELFDYEEARRRVVIAANRASAYNPSGRGVALLVDERLVEIPPGQTISLTQD